MFNMFKFKAYLYVQQHWHATRMPELSAREYAILVQAVYQK